MTNEELHAIRSMMREEVNAAIYASEQRTNEKFATIVTYFQTNIPPIGERLGRIETRLEHVEIRLEHVEIRLEHVETRLEHVETRLEHVETRLEHVETRLDQIEPRLNRLEGLVEPMKDHLILINAGQKQLMSDFVHMQSEHEHITIVLEDMTTRINDLQAGQTSLEMRFGALETRFGLLEIKVDENRRDIQKLTHTVQISGKQMSNAITELKMRLQRHENTSLDEAHPKPHSTA